MTSIFSTDFIRNLERTQLSTQRSEQPQKGQGPQFARVLSDIEKPADKGIKTKDLEASRPRLGSPHEPGKVPKDHHTNIGPLEHSHFREKVSEAYKKAGDVAPGAIDGVKTAPTSVKEAPLTSEVAKPEIPNLLSVQRTGQGEVIDQVGPNARAFSTNEIKNIISTAGKFHGVDPDLSLAVAQAESSLNPTAVSQDGHESKGIFQLLDTTGTEMLSRLGGEEKDYEPFDPGMNAYLGVGYLRRLHDIFSTETQLTKSLTTSSAKSAADLEKLATAAFNAGEGSVARAQAKAIADGGDPGAFADIERHLPLSTQQYVSRVMEKRDEFQLRTKTNEVA